MEQWSWPGSSKLTKLEKIFDKDRRKGNRDGDSFRCQASQGLCVYAVLRFWIIMFAMPNGICPGALDAFLKFCIFVDMILEVSRGRGTITPTMLLDKVESFLAAFVAEWGVEAMTPKVHWMLHFHRELRIHKILYGLD